MAVCWVLITASAAEVEVMGDSCYFCPRWNDWLGQCDAPYWCPDKDKVNDSLEQPQKSAD